MPISRLASAAAIAALAAALAAPCAAAQQAARPGEGSFWDKASEGYWWYAKEPAAKKPPEPQEKKPAPQPRPQKKDEQALAKDEPKAPPVGSTAWIQKNLDSYLQLALDQPTVANVRAYLYVQRLALDRSQQFAESGRLAVEGDPFLDEAARGPIAGGANIRNRAYRVAENERLLKRLYSKVGVFYVFKNACELCDEQAGVLKQMENFYGLTVKAVSLDEPQEGSKSAELFPDYTVDPKALTYFRILALPATLLYDSTTNTAKPLLQGMVSMSDLNSRAIRAAHKYGWLPDSEFYYAKAFEDATSLSGVLSPSSELSGRLGREGGKDPYGNNTNFIEPQKLVEMIRDAKYKEIPAGFVPRGY